MVRNELWDQESEHSDSYLPPMKAEYDSRSVAGTNLGGEYGRPGSVMTAQGPGNGYDPRGVTHMTSYQDLRAHTQQDQSRVASLHNPQRISYDPYAGNRMTSPFASNLSLHQTGIYDDRSLYQAASGPGSAHNSFYGNANTMQHLQLRDSAYSFGQQPYGHGMTTRDQDRHVSHANPSRPATQVLPEIDWAPLDLGEAGISDAQLEKSIRRICAEADLDNLTKKGVRKQLEQEHGVGLDQRKESINRIIEMVLNGQCNAELSLGKQLNRQNSSSSNDSTI